MIFTRPIRPGDARRFLSTGLRRLDALSLETFTPAWSRPRAGR